MTSNDEKTMYDEYAGTTEGARELAAADFAIRVSELLGSAFRRSGLTNHEFAGMLNVSDGRASQILNSDGNLRVSTIAKSLHALGWAPWLTARDQSGAELATRDRSYDSANSRRSQEVDAETTTYRVTVLGEFGVGEVDFDLEHDEPSPPVMLNIPSPADPARQMWTLVDVAELTAAEPIETTDQEFV